MDPGLVSNHQPLRLQESIDIDVLENVPLFGVRMEPTFVPHAELQHDATGGGVARQVFGLDAI